MFCGLQLLAIGIPLNFMVADKPLAGYFARVGVIFLTALTVMVLVFAPKLHAYHIEPRRSQRRSQRTQSVHSVQSVVRVHSVVHKSVRQVNPAGGGSQTSMAKCGMDSEKEELAEENESLRARMATLREELEDLKLVLHNYTASQK